MKLNFYNLKNKACMSFIPLKLFNLSLFSAILILFISLANNLNAQTIPSLMVAKNDIPKPEKTLLDAQSKQTATQTLRQSTNAIWFEKNAGQFADKKILYGFHTTFGSMGVFGNKLRLVTKQTENGKNIGQQIVDITFPGSLQKWIIVPGTKSEVKGSYNTKSGTIAPDIYNEITLQDVYTGIDLRLYSGENGSLEFDWLVNKASDYDKIRMKFDGQDGIKVEKSGNVIIDLRSDDLKICIPETYQVINGSKKQLVARMKTLADKKTICYKISGDTDPTKPLVIDPVMIWSTYMHNNTKTFDEYLYTVAANADNEVYACGMTNEAIGNAAMAGNAPGFSGSYTYDFNSAGDAQSVILYQLNATGTAIRAWTYTGQTTNIPVAMGIFPNNKILVVYQTDTVQIFSADLLTRFYNGVIDAPNVAANVYAYQSLAIVDNDVFYLGGIAESALPSSIVPLTAPDNTIGGREGVILRIGSATSIPVAEWGTYIGGSGNETFTAIALSADKTKLAFGVHVEGAGSGYPALVNAVDNTIAGNELLVGAFTLPYPAVFDVFSYLGGSGNEGSTANISNAALVAADSTYFYVAGNTCSTNMPGVTGAAQTTHGANSKFADQFVSRIPLNGSAGTGFVTTYNGGNDIDLIGGLVIDSRTNDVLLFGTTASMDFPVINPTPASPFYQGIHGDVENGPDDITYTIFTNDLSQRAYSTFIGGSYNDYLGSTGKLQGTGHFQYNPSNGLTYIGTTIHSDQTTIPTQWMTSIPGMDKSIPPATTGKDNHYIFAINPNTSDFGDAPLSYDAGTPASSAVSFFDIRIGLTEDAEPKANNSIAANGDDLQNYGSADDEDGIVTVPSIPAGATSYTVNVSVYNNTTAPVLLCGWIDTNGNGVFDSNEFTSVSVPVSASQQNAVLTFTGLPPFPFTIGSTYLRIRMSDINLTAANATGAFGKGEVEDYIVPKAVLLPIEIEQFTAVPQGESVLLQWAISLETNITSYQVEHCTDGISYSSIGDAVANGSTNYSMVHTSPATGINYYRIKMIGTNGRVTYSIIRKVNFTKGSMVTIYPNPAKDMINITSSNMVNKPVTISLLAADGKVVSRQYIPIASQTETMDVSRFPKGHYIVKIETSIETLTKMIDIIH